MRKILLVAQREFFDNARTKGFWIGVFIFPVMLTLALVVPTLLEKTKDARHYAVVDQSGWLLPAVERRAEANDLGELLKVVASDQLKGGDDLAKLPAPLRTIAPTAQALGPTALVTVGRALAGDTGVTIPDSAAPIMQRRDAILAWWRGLSPQEVRKLVPKASRAQYILERTSASDSVLNQRVARAKLFAYFVIGPDPLKSAAGSRYVSKNLTDNDLQKWFEGLASAEVQSRRMAQEKIDPTVAKWIQSPLTFAARQVTGAGVKQVKTSDRIRQYAPIAFVYLLWISVFTISQMLLTNTIEEKSNRIIEVLLSSVSPVELMAGKIMGIAASGLALVGSWMVFLLVAIELLPTLIGLPPTIDLTVLVNNPVYVGSFIVYFVLGFLLYASLLVAIGAVCNTLKEAQNLMGPITILLIIPLFAMMPIGKDPNGTLAKVLSYIPPFTPFVMMNRAAGPPSPVEYALTTLLLVGAIGAALWAAAKVFRIGILLTGKPPRLVEIIRWIRAPVGVVPARKET